MMKFYLNWANTIFKRKGFQVCTPKTREELREYASNPGHRNYLMDANFGNEESLDITPTLEVRDRIRARTDSADVRLLAISGDNVIVDSCLAKEIQAKVKPIRWPELVDFFKRE
jgi:hypothetical protein